MDVDGNLDQALNWSKLATEQSEHSWAWFIRAKIEAKKGDISAAVASGTKCAEIGLMSQTDTFYKENAEEVNAYIQSWASKMN
jgi:ATP/maltotriose-dependent transcriptional regulator MalT